MTRTLVLTSFLIVLAAPAYSDASSNGHNFDESRCGDCHAANPEAGVRSTLRMTASVQELCHRCHGQMKKMPSHPVEMKPKWAILPPDFPLDQDGNMTCSTCHDIHRTNIPGARHPSLRRQLTGSAFCAMCHIPGAPQDGDTTPHDSLDQVHMKSERGTSKESLDPVSLQCMSCHDGSLSSNGDVKITGEHGFALSPTNGQGSHPIGIKYKRAMRSQGGLRPPSLLDPAIMLINGKVGCASCHNIYSKEPKLLTMSNRGSALCLSCHDK